MKESQFFDDLIEPKALCGNCDYRSPFQDGHICINTRSPKYTAHVFEDDTCGRFFWPDHKRWPDCDHD